MGKHAQRKLDKQSEPGLSATQAERADRHHLYQEAVQAAETEVDFMIDTYRSLRGREPLVLREDFCGTALLAAQWCRTDPQRTALGVDFCPETLAWGREHNIEPAGEDVAKRLTLVEADVRTDSDIKADVTCAFNFSYCTFKTRDELRHYFETARAGLKEDGMLMLDLFGGTESYDTLKEETKLKGQKATYIWEHASFNPIDHRMTCNIHFDFKDGSRMDKAFTYEWRVWIMPEVIELLEEAGFKNVRVYWERFEDDDDDDDYLEGTGEYEEVTEVENQESWMSYIVAET